MSVHRRFGDLIRSPSPLLQTSSASATSSTTPTPSASVSAAPPAFVQTTIDFYSLPGGTVTSRRRLAALTAGSALSSLAPGVICDVARVADVDPLSVKVVAVRLLDAAAGGYTATRVSTAAFPNTLTRAACDTVRSGGTVNATTNRVRRLQATILQPLVSFTVLVIVPTTATSPQGGITTSSAADLVTATTAVQGKLSAALAANSVTVASDGSLNLGPFTAATSAWLTANSYIVSATGAGTAVVADPSGAAVQATSIAAAVGGQASSGGVAVSQALADMAAAGPTASSRTGSSPGVIAGATLGTIAAALILLGAVWKVRQRRERQALGTDQASTADRGSESVGVAADASPRPDGPLRDTTSSRSPRSFWPASPRVTPITARFVSFRERSPDAEAAAADAQTPGPSAEVISTPLPPVGSSAVLLPARDTPEAVSSAFVREAWQAPLDEPARVPESAPIVAGAAAPAPDAPAREEPTSSSVARLSLTLGHGTVKLPPIGGGVARRSSVTLPPLVLANKHGARNSYVSSSAAAASEAPDDIFGLALSSALSPHLPAGSKGFGELEAATGAGGATDGGPERKLLNYAAPSAPSGLGAAHRSMATEDSSGKSSDLRAVSSTAQLLANVDPVSPAAADISKTMRRASDAVASLFSAGPSM